MTDRLWRPEKPKLILPGWERPPERKRPGLPEPRLTRIQCVGCGAAQDNRQRRPMDAETLANTRCVVCRSKGARIVPTGQ